MPDAAPLMSGGITHLADMLGVTRQSAERLLNDFEVAKILDNQRGAVTIKDRSKLHDRACACSRMLAKRLRALFVCSVCSLAS